MNVDSAKLRQFINDHFGPEDLRTFLFDYFRSVYDDLTDGLTKSKQISLLLEYCHKYKKFPDLLAAIQREHPFFQPDDYVQGQKAPAAAPQPPAPITRNPRQIFISHAHQDAEVAQRLAHDLEAHGYDIWIAPDSIRPGEKWVEAINRGLEESGIFVLLLSPDAVASRWVQMETNVAITYTHEDEIQLYPLMLKACRLPALWRAFQHISFREGYKMGFQTLADVLNQTTRKSIVVAAQREASEATFFHGRTGKEFVRVPSGHFFFGTEKTMPTYLGAFWIAKTLVTNAEYAQFLNELGANEMMKLRIQPPKHWRGMMPPLHLVDHPVVFVSWHEANEYAKWAGAELPTEHQWEKAARGWDGRKYPWGNYWTEGCCNSMESGINTTTSVGQYSPQGDSPYGCSDLVGNVWEWTRSKWQLDSPWIVRRGGSWHLSSLDLVVANARNNNAPFDKYESLGFRIILTNV